MLENQRLSVIIPIYNVEPYLRQCLDSVVNQTYSNLEILLIDDGSQDGCGVICDEYASKDGRIMAIHKKNEGVSIARNLGIEKATGEWITFVDPDDWCELEYYDELISAIADRKPDIFCAGGSIWEYAQSSIQKVYAKENCYIEKEQSGGIWEILPARVLDQKINVSFLENNYPGGFCWDKLYRADFIKGNGFVFEPNLHPFEDALLNCMLFDHAERIGGSTYIGYHYRQTNLLSATKKFQPDLVFLTISYIEKLSMYQNNTQNAILRRTIKRVALSGVRECFKNWSLYRSHGMVDRVEEEFYEIKNNPYIQNIVFDSNDDDISMHLLFVKYILRLPRGLWLAKLYGHMDRLYFHIKNIKHKRRSMK